MDVSRKKEKKKGDIDCLKGWLGSLQAGKEFAAFMFLFCFVREMRT